MKEIKFRQPHKCHNGHFAYLYFDLIGDQTKNHTWNKNCNCSTLIFGEGFTHCGETELYIGRHDKNKLPIYENDIIKVPEGYGGDHYYKEYIGIVTYKDYEVYVDAFKYEKGYQDFNWSKVEVISNKYQKEDL